MSESNSGNNLQKDQKGLRAAGLALIIGGLVAGILAVTFVNAIGAGRLTLNAIWELLGILELAGAILLAIGAKRTLGRIFAIILVVCFTAYIILLFASTIIELYYLPH